ncbi:MAG TPA: Ig-like domain repeat protein [Bryobacteraceae bacterium]|nr:Ig-like domain repeat protein [Bryobacteraceae bacterium]
MTGFTTAPQFPVTPGAYQMVCGYVNNFGDSCPNTQSAFLTKLSPNGSLVYSTYLGHLNETGVAVAVDSQGRAYVAGNSSANCTTAVPTCFPTTANAVLQGSVFNNSVNPTNQQVGSAFISVFDATGANLLYSSLYGYSDITTTNHGATYGVGVAVDASGNFYLAGDTQNSGLPVTAGAFQHYIGNMNPALASNSRGFVAKFNPVSAGAGLAYATYLGGTDPAQGAFSDGIGGIAADAAGNAYVSGNASYNFPVTAGAYDTNPCPSTLCQNRAFLAKINPAGSALVWSTFIGGARPDLSAVNSISAPRLDANGNLYVSGAAGNNTQVPLVNPLQPANGFGGVYVTKFDPTGSTVLFSTVIYDPTANGGLFNSGVDVDTQGNVYVAGNANVGGLPVTAVAFQHASAGSADGFIAKLNLLLSPSIGLVVAPGTANAGSPVTFTATVTGVAGKPIATGTVNFMAGAMTLGSATLNAGGVATLVSSAINGGNYSVTPVYAGDSIYATVTSAASPLTITGSLPCTYSFSSNGQAFPSTGGAGNIAITVVAGCPWTVGALPPFATLTSSGSGSGNGTVTFTVALNSGGDRTGSFSINGQTFTIEQEAASITGLNLIGSMPHIAAEENWTTMFTMVNNTGSSNQVRFSLFGSNLDASGSGNALQLPLNLPQQASLGVLLGASLDNTLSPNASWIVSTGGQGIAPVQTGSAQVSATGALGGFAIFHRFSDAQEAVVPLTAGTPNAPSYLLAFDNTNGIVTSVAVANVSSLMASIGYIIRDDTGAQIGSGTLAALPGNGQIAFVLPDAATGFPVTANKRGTVEFDTPAGGQISVLGIRNTPQVTDQGMVTTLTTVPALANVGTGGGSFAFIASGGDGWQTTFVLVNAGSSTASATLKFFDPNGNPLSLPLSFPQTGVVNQAPSINPTLAAAATLLVQSSGAANLLTGSAQLTTTGNVSGFVIFRHNGQEAVVPIESRNANAYVLAFDNTGGTATGLAVDAVTSSTQPVNVPVVIRDDSGNQLATDSLPLAANGDFAGDLAQNSPTLGRVLFPATANIRGTVEFDAPAGVHIGVIGIRTPPTSTPTYTSLPALAR